MLSTCSSNFTSCHVKHAYGARPEQFSAWSTHLQLSITRHTSSSSYVLHGASSKRLAELVRVLPLLDDIDTYRYRIPAYRIPACAGADTLPFTVRTVTVQSRTHFIRTYNACYRSSTLATLNTLCVDMHVIWHTLRTGSHLSMHDATPCVVDVPNEVSIQCHEGCMKPQRHSRPPRSCIKGLIQSGTPTGRWATLITRARQANESGLAGLHSHTV